MRLVMIGVKGMRSIRRRERIRSCCMLCKRMSVNLGQRQRDNADRVRAKGASNAVVARGTIGKSDILGTSDVSNETPEITRKVHDNRRDLACLFSKELHWAMTGNRVWSIFGTTA